MFEVGRRGLELEVVLLMMGGGEGEGRLYVGPGIRIL